MTTLERADRVRALVQHQKNPCCKGKLDDYDALMPGGSPECGGSVMIYLKSEGDGRIEAVSFTGQGDTISMGATSMILQLVRDEGLTMEEVLALDYEEFIDRVGRDVVGSRTRNATLGLSTLKSVVRKYLRDEIGNSAKRPANGSA